MDAVDTDLVDTSEASLRAVPGVGDVEELRLRWVGHRVRAEADIVVDPTLSLVAAHDISTAVQHRLLHDVPRPVAATVHVSPRSTTGQGPSRRAGSSPRAARARRPAFSFLVSRASSSL
jgi:divalent metal cation (Fe/Co/Zn/Cd) transporter